MKKFNLFSILLLIAVGIATTQPLTSQSLFNAKQATENFKFTTYNVEWLSCTTFGPTDEELQMNNIVAVIKAMQSDIVALQEVGTSSSYTTIDTLVRRLGSEWAGSMIAYYVDNCSQNEGLVYKKSKVQLLNASLMTNAGSSYNWSGGRYPVVYNVNLLVDDTSIPVSIINIHAKARNDETSYYRRKNASEGLKTLLDGNMYNSKRIVLLGDFNDYLIGSMCADCGNSPYKNFMDDTQHYKGLTSGLYDPSYYSPVIDNFVISNELFDNYKLNTAIREVVATQSVVDYTNTTSDHVPISVLFSMTAGAPGCENINYSEAFGASLGDFTSYNTNGSQVWAWRLNFGATVSGFENATNSANEDWLISPAFDLSKQSSATLAFSHALNFCPSASDIITNQTLWVSSNYTNGAPSAATWTPLAIPTMPSGNNWTFVNSGDIQLPTQMLKNNVRFAFKYLSTATVAGTWEIKDLMLNTECIPMALPGEITTLRNAVYGSKKLIKISNQKAVPVVIVDITGRVIYSDPAITKIEIPIAQAGVYIVRTGNQINKVVVR